MISDMTKGNPLKLILSFSVPMLIGNIFQQVYNFVDAAIVGKFVGAESLAAVGSTGTIVGVMICLMMGLTSGAGIIIAQCFGSRNFDELRKTVTGLIYIVGILAVITSVAGVVFSRPILSFLNTPDNVIDEAVAYINVIFAFTIGTAMYNASSAILRSLGDSRTPLYALILSSILNVIFDLLFVVVFKTGVVGAAVATVIAQIISAIYCIIHMIRHRRQLNLEGINFKQQNVQSSGFSNRNTVGAEKLSDFTRHNECATSCKLIRCNDYGRLYCRRKNRLNRNRTDCIGRLGIVGFLGSKHRCKSNGQNKKGYVSNTCVTYRYMYSDCCRNCIVP